MDTQRFEELSSCPNGEAAPQSAQRPFNIIFLGANLPNLVAALALTSHYEGVRIQVYEKHNELPDEDFVVALSTESWKMLTAISPIVTRALMSKGLLLNYPIDVAKSSTGYSAPSSTVYTTLEHLLNLLVSVLPSGSVTFGAFPSNVNEAHEGINLEMQDGSVVTTKLLVGAFKSLKEESKENVYTEVNFRVSGDASSLDSSEFADCGTYARSHKLNDSIHIITAIVRSNEMERSISCLSQFPKLYKYLSESTVEEHTTQQIAGVSEIYCGKGRSTRLDCFIQSLPCISTKMLETALGMASLLKGSISEKGLTSAALREFERLMRSEVHAQGGSEEHAHALSRWGLTASPMVKEASRPHLINPAVSPQKAAHDILLAKGLLYAGPREGMGWRIIS